jgi:hypothetical protein
MVNIKPLPLYLQHSMDKGLGGTQSQCGFYVEKNLALPKTKLKATNL